MMPSGDTTGQKAIGGANRELMEVFENPGSPYDDFLQLKPTIKADLAIIQNALQEVKSDKKVALHENWYDNVGGTTPYSLAVEVKCRFFKPGQNDFVRVEFEPRHQGDDGQTYTNQLVAAIGRRGGTFVSEDAVIHTHMPTTSLIDHQEFRANLFRTILQSDLFNSPEERNHFASLMKNKFKQAQSVHTPS